MADIQHKDIPDSGRHEPKGASTAASGSVIVSNGAGGTTFKKLTTDSLQGTLTSGPLSVKDDGTFTTSGTVYASINKTSSASSSLVGTSNGVTISGANFSVSETGIYRVEATNGISVTTATQINYVEPSGTLAATSTSTVVYPTFRNSTTSTVLFTGISGLVELTAGTLYTFNTPAAIRFNIERVA